MSSPTPSKTGRKFAISANLRLIFTSYLVHNELDLNTASKLRGTAVLKPRELCIPSPLTLANELKSSANQCRKE